MFMRDPLMVEQESDLTGCRCPPGFTGDGQKCEGVLKPPPFF